MYIAGLMKFFFGPLMCMGICTDVDVGIWRLNASTWVSTFEGVSRDSMGVTLRSVRLFKKNYPSMTDSCIECHAGLSHCGAKHCLLACLTDRHGGSCKECVSKHCLNPYYTCIGPVGAPPSPWST